MKRSPLRSKRPTPRRDEGRIRHDRMRPKTVEPTAAQQRYHYWVRQQPAACGHACECVHHILSSAAGKKGRRDHWFVVGLCHQCHNLGTVSVHLLGSEARFRERTGIDLVLQSLELRLRYASS